MRQILKIVVIVFTTAYVLALALFAIGTLGLFGSPSGPLAGIFLVPIGLPWNLLIDGVTESVRPWLAVAAPALNLAILATLWKWASRY